MQQKQQENGSNHMTHIVCRQYYIATHYFYFHALIGSNYMQDTYFTLKINDLGIHR